MVRMMRQLWRRIPAIIIVPVIALPLGSLERGGEDFCEGSNAPVAASAVTVSSVLKVDELPPGIYCRFTQKNGAAVDEGPGWASFLGGWAWSVAVAIGFGFRAPPAGFFRAALHAAVALSIPAGLWTVFGMEFLPAWLFGGGMGVLLSRAIERFTRASGGAHDGHRATVVALSSVSVVALGILVGAPAVAALTVPVLVAVLTIASNRTRPLRSVPA